MGRGAGGASSFLASFIPHELMRLVLVESYY